MKISWPESFKPLQNGAVLRSQCPTTEIDASPWVSNPFKTGRYCVVLGINTLRFPSASVSNPFKTGRYCVGSWSFSLPVKDIPFQTPSKRGGTA